MLMHVDVDVYVVAFDVDADVRGGDGICKCYGKVDVDADVYVDVYVDMYVDMEVKMDVKDDVDVNVNVGV